MSHVSFESMHLHLVARKQEVNLILVGRIFHKSNSPYIYFDSSNDFLAVQCTIKISSPF